MIDSTVINLLRMSNFHERLQLAMSDAHVSTTDLAAILRSSTGDMGVSKQAIHQALTGNTKSMTAENVARAAAFLKCDHYWLATGERLPIEASMQWPFESFTRSRFDRLTERQKGEVEKAALDAINAIEARTGNHAAA